MTELAGLVGMTKQGCGQFVEQRWRDAVGPGRYTVFREVLGELSAGAAGSVAGSRHG